MTLSGPAAVNIPELTYIERELNVGTIDFGFYFRDHQWSNCFPTPGLTNFTAPKLAEVDGYIKFDSSPVLTNISFPALRSVGGITMENTAAANLPIGISMPVLKKLCSVQVVGTAPNCTSLDALHNWGVVAEHYFCGTNETVHMTFISDSCARSIKSWCETLLDFCNSHRGNWRPRCYRLRDVFETLFAPVFLIVAGAALFLYVLRKWYASVRLIDAEWRAMAEAARRNAEAAGTEVKSRS